MDNQEQPTTQKKLKSKLIIAEILSSNDCSYIQFSESKSGKLTYLKDKFFGNWKSARKWLEIRGFRPTPMCEDYFKFIEQDMEYEGY